jgi:uncharacterized protein YjbI with pentapeptide repeats
MEQRDATRRRASTTRWLWAGGIVALVFLVFLIVVIGGYVFDWKWTGFPNRKLWDWLKLLIVPAVLALGGFLFTRSENNRAQDIAKRQRAVDLQVADQQRQDEALQAYLDHIGGLLLDEGRPLREAGRFDEVVILARSRTLMLLSQLDGEHKARVLQFLFESNLIIDTTGGVPKGWLGDISPVLLLGGEDILGGADLTGARLSGAQLPYVNLSAVWLVGADLSFANLHSALLFRARLYKANLHKADLSSFEGERRTFLKSAYLEEAILTEANLSGADLRDSNLNGAYLTGANLTGADLSSFLNEPPWGLKLNGADLTGADLTDADIGGTDLSGAKGLSYEQIEKAMGNHETKLPQGLDHPGSWDQYWTKKSSEASIVEAKDPPTKRLVRVREWLGRLKDVPLRRR